MEIVHGNWKGFTGRGLTRRELECTLGAAAGLTDKEIAKVLGIAPDTVKKRVRNALFRLNVPRRAALVAEAMRRAIIAPLVILLCVLTVLSPLLDQPTTRSTRTVRTVRTVKGGRGLADLGWDLV